MTAERSQNPRPITPRSSAEPTLDQELCALVVDTAPQLFAVVQVRGDSPVDTDGWVAAWGLVNDDGLTHVISVDRQVRMTLASPERVLRHFARHPEITSRLVWLAQPRGAAMDRPEAA